MLQASTDDRKVFEVSIYNKEVRSLVKENQSHAYFDDQWADVQVCDVLAADEAEAMTVIQERYPPDDGFVVEDIVSSDL